MTADVSEFDSDDAALAHGRAISRARAGADVHVHLGQQHLQTVADA